MKYAVYARVSSEDQADRGTIENQLEFARKYCDLHQIRVNDWYKDDGITGTLPLEQRPEGQRLLEDARAGRLDLVLIYKLDRLGRSARVVLNAVYELEQCGVKIRSMTEPFDTGDPSGRFLLTILAGVADLERETILERMWHGANRAARDGKWLGGIVPYGYRVNEDRYLAISEEPLPGHDLTEAGVVRLIYQLVADQGMSTIKVADYLNALGVPPSYSKDGRQVRKGKRKEKTSGAWLPGRIRNMIVSTTYKGLHQYGKRSSKDREVIPREVPAIVSEETWEKAQRVLRDNQIEATRNAKRQNLLRGLVKCSVCGLNYVGTSHKGPGGKQKPYYVCDGKISYRGKLHGKCTSKNVPAEWLEDVVWDDCVRFINRPGEAVKELAASMEDSQIKKADLSGELDLVQKAARDKDLEKQSILDLFRKQVITASDVEAQLTKIGYERAALEQRAKQLQRQMDDEESLADKFDTAEALLADLRRKLTPDPDWQTRRDIIKTLVKEVTIETTYNDYGRPLAKAQVRFTFSRGVPRTDVRAALPGTVHGSVVAPTSK